MLSPESDAFLLGMVAGIEHAVLELREGIDWYTAAPLTRHEQWMTFGVLADCANELAAWCRQQREITLTAGIPERDISEDRR